MNAVQVLVVGPIKAREPVEIAFNQVRHAESPGGHGLRGPIIP